MSFSFLLSSFVALLSLAATPSFAQLTVTGEGDVSLQGLSVTGDGDVELDGLSVTDEGDVRIDGGLSAGGDGNVSIGGGLSAGVGGVSLGDISVGADGEVAVPGLRVEGDGSVSMGSEIDVDVLTEAMETPGTSVNVSILFASGSADLTEKGKAQVAKVAEAFFFFDEDVKVLVEGHTDNVGSDADNFALSNARSQTVMNELVLVHDVDLTLLTGGKGESSPVADNASDAGRALNRRVTFIRN